MKPPPTPPEGGGLGYFFLFFPFFLEIFWWFVPWSVILQAFLERQHFPMYLERSTDESENFRQIVGMRDDLNRRLSGLLRHYTGISATLLALLSLFGDIGSLCLLPRVLLLLCMTCLVSSVLSGVWCCMAGYLTLERTLGRVIDTFQGDDSDSAGVLPVPKGFSFFVRFCPATLCLGVLLLWMSGIAVLFF